ncbi:lysozyme inhibitor LprI family protein [Endozoicomonas elysicola]|uniref:lysozyme inhibitor LprI family protein n=1 Tax=Endozoicomonas elysicola TaxID=305900 RepID=UPI000B07F6BD|nr:lysozyme inhibitor LprI family protein [Endozoicomonas elysicola]
MMKKGWGIILALMAFTASAAETIDCSKAYTTIEINQCATIELGVAQKEMQRYFDASLKHNSFDTELVAAIRAAQSDWEKYYNSH